MTETVPTAAITPTATRDSTAADPRPGRGLRDLREAACLDVATFAERLGMRLDRYTACEAGEALLPTTKLVRLAEVCGAPLSDVLVVLHGRRADTTPADLETLARSFTKIRTPAHRKAVLHLALDLAPNKHRAGTS
jgi:hypothetical protein